MSHGCRLALVAVLAAAVSACSTRDDTDDVESRDAGSDAGSTDAGTDGGSDAGTDAGSDAGFDAGTDAGVDLCGFDFQHKVGYGCNLDADCESGICIVDIFGLSYCTEGCDPDLTDACPDGFTCAESGSAAIPFICEPSDGYTTLPADGSLVPGAPCNVDADCKGTGSRCLGIERDDLTSFTFCAPACTAEGDECGECGSCQAGEDGGICIPKGTGQTGDACTARHDCGSFICVGYCTQQCGDEACPGSTDLCQEVSDTLSICISERQNAKTPANGDCVFAFECEDGNKCLPDATGSKTVCTLPKTKDDVCRASAECAAGLFCVPNALGGDDTCQPPGVIGAACETAEHCGATLTCRDVALSLSLCSKGCEGGCGQGNSCVAVDLDTDLKLFNSPTATTSGWIQHNDDIDLAGGNLFSDIRTVELQPGTYFVSVDTFGTFLGRYRLDLLDETGGSDTYFDNETPVRNDTLAAAQLLPTFPAIVEGNIESAADIDYFSFTIGGSAAVRVRLRTRAGDPSACLPNSLVAISAVGAPCAFNQACASGLCEGRLDVCGQACTTDAGCGTGFKCVELNDHKTCVTSATVAAKARDATCQFAFECADGYCGRWKSQSFCTPRCEAPTDLCGAGSECTDLKIKRDGVDVVERQCVPEGAKTGVFNAQCVLQSDCKAGLICEEGRCAPLCANDAACPGQTFPGGQPAPVCDACEDSADCGTGFSCQDGVGLERYCAPDCGAADACPAGFTCEDDYGDKVCRPTHGSCRRPVCSIPTGASTGVCTVPVAEFAELCDAADECTTASCAGGLCSKSCDATLPNPCGCSTGDLVCTQNRCERAPYLAEVEGAGRNDTRLTAQPLTGNLPLQLFAELRASGSDEDWFKINLVEAKHYDLITRPVCGTAALGLNTNLTLYDSAGVRLKDDEFVNYGFIADYTAPAGGAFYLHVEDYTYPSTRGGAYILEIKEHTP